MSVGTIGGPGYSPLNSFTGTAPDSEQEVVCVGARRLQIQISNQAVLIRFGRGPGAGAITYDVNPEFYLPLTGQIGRPFDAFKIRAATPAAQLPAGATQAFVSLVPR